MAAFRGWFLALELVGALLRLGGRLVVFIFGRGPALGAGVAVVVLDGGLGLNLGGLLVAAFVLSSAIRIAGGDQL
jgi:hypothetical protein